MRLAFFTILWVGGLMLAGSESVFMPKANIIGLVMFLLASIMIIKEFNRRKRRSIWHHE